LAWYCRLFVRPSVRPSLCLSVAMCIIMTLRVCVRCWKLYKYLLVPSRGLHIHFFGHFCCRMYHLATNGKKTDSRHHVHVHILFLPLTDTKSRIQFETVNLSKCSRCWRGLFQGILAYLTVKRHVQYRHPTLQLAYINCTAIEMHFLTWNAVLHHRNVCRFMNSRRFMNLLYRLRQSAPGWPVSVNKHEVVTHSTSCILRSSAVHAQKCVCVKRNYSLLNLNQITRTGSI